MTIMAELDLQNIDDLEDGEIESDSEQAEIVAPEPPHPEPAQPQEEPRSKPSEKDNHSKKAESRHEKRRSKEHHSKSDREFRGHKDKSRRPFLLPTPVEDDYAGSIEKAIRMAMKKGNENSGDYKIEIDKFDSGIDDLEGKRKHKKRKKHDQQEKESSKKRKKREEVSENQDEMDEDEMMCVRGASPVFKQALQPESFENYPSEEEYDSASSADSRGGGRDRGGRSGRGRGSGGRGDRRPDRNHRPRPRRQDMHPMQDPDGVCLFYMQGKCYKGDDCTFSHDAQPPRKMELCKFYLMDCCAKRDKCLYLHSDFPCKYYHTGLSCIYKDDCKFAHGKPLSESLKLILLKHIESAPKEILGDFPRLSREQAGTMVTNTQNKLMQQFSPTKSNKEKNIPSIFELNVPKPVGFDDNVHSNNSMEMSHNDKGKNSNKVRHSRWCDTSSPQLPLLSTPISNNPSAAENILSVQNLHGVLTPKQINELLQLGIDNLNQLSQLTVIQLNQLGLTMNQINEIQLNTMSIQKLGLINSQSSNSNNLFNNAKMNKDLDMRVSPALNDMNITPKAEILSKDIDMRFQPSTMHPPPVIEKDSRISESTVSADPRRQKPSIDIDQYTKDALKFSKVEKENHSNSDNDGSKGSQENDKKTDLDTDHRVLKYISDATVANVKLALDANFGEMESDMESNKKVTLSTIKQDTILNIQKKNEQIRRATTDDEDDNLQIDEKWYSSDEEHSDKVVTKVKSPSHEEKPNFYTPSSEPNIIEPTTVITKLGDLSKIDISAEVTKLLSSIKRNTSSEEKEIKKEETRPRDPRNSVKKSPEHKSSIDVPKKVSTKPGFVSIYNCIEGGGGDSRKRIDIDLRPIKDLDLRLPTFGDTDLRQTPGSGDVDLRLGLPFKPLPNYTPASEIDGSINSHPPIAYKLLLVDVPRPDYTDIRNSTPKSQASSDPRLRKIFRLSLDENPLEPTEKQAKPANVVRSDPRKRHLDTTSNKQESSSTKTSPLDLQAVIQASNWYKELSSNQKILVNQQLASVTMNFKKFHQDNTPGKIFDLTEIHSNAVLTKILANLGIILNEKGEFTQVKLPETPAPAMPQHNFNQNETYGNVNMSGMMDNVNMMGMNPMGPNMGPMGGGGPMGPMGNFDMRFQGGDPRGAPGLLGIAPNIPHNFDSNFNGMPNFGNDNNFNSNNNFNNNSGMFNGPGGNMNEYRGDGNYDNFRNQKNDFKPFRGGRGGERWRGARGRDRRGYTDRGGGNGGNWKGDRR